MPALRPILAAASAAALLASFTAVARAAPPPDPDAGARLIAACVAGAGNMATSCIGLMADTCLKTADSTQRMAECETHELKIWDGWLNRDYPAVMARLKPRARTALRRIEHAFVAETARRCGFIATVNGPTTMNAPHVAECRLRATAIQWLWLKDFKAAG